MRSNCHEKDEVYGTADRVCAKTGRNGGEGCRSVPEDGDQRGPAFNWKRKYGGLGATELRKLKQLEDENSRAEKDRGGSDARQADAAGRAQKKL